MVRFSILRNIRSCNETKISFFNNTKYALCGVVAMLKNEVAFKIEWYCHHSLAFCYFLFRDSA
ncbi:hypothetical protein [uncultured Helicobacter sp.]|uniref:hypothetical protein n=1 Tax=uncultured Helicobacter sp. TaxID=175537 RepID=UPI002615055B|nr:hypothetical protein [uncultured Helicobacter sp.]